MSIYRCNVPTISRILREFQAVKNKAHVNAFLYIAVLFSHHIPLGSISTTDCRFCFGVVSPSCKALSSGCIRLQPCKKRDFKNYAQR